MAVLMPAMDLNKAQSSAGSPHPRGSDLLHSTVRPSRDLPGHRWTQRQRQAGSGSSHLPGHQAFAEDSIRIDLAEELVKHIAHRVAGILGVPDLPEPNPLLSVTEAADYLRCKPKRIHDLCSQRRLEFEKDGSRTLIRRRALDAYLEKGQPAQ